MNLRYRDKEYTPFCFPLPLLLGQLLMKLWIEAVAPAANPQPTRLKIMPLLADGGRLAATQLSLIIYLSINSGARLSIASAAMIQTVVRIGTARTKEAEIMIQWPWG